MLQTRIKRKIITGLVISLVGIVSYAPEVRAYVKEDCAEWQRANPPGFATHSNANSGVRNISNPIVTASFVGYACSVYSRGRFYLYSPSAPSIQYDLDPLSSDNDFERDDSINVVTRHSFSGDLRNIPGGRYRYGFEGFTNTEGNSASLQTVLNQKGNPIEIIWTPSSPTSTFPQAPIPEVLTEYINLVVHRAQFFASAYYSVNVRCSFSCGKLPDTFHAKLCEIGTSYRSPTCIARASMSPQGLKKKVTKSGASNFFFGTFSFQRKPTGKTYVPYLNIPAGKNHKPTIGGATVVWSTRTAVLAKPSQTSTPTSTTVVSDRTNVAGTTTSVPSSNSNGPVSNGDVYVIQDLMSGKAALEVKGSGASVTIDVTLGCSGKCTSLPATITGRLCREGTSDSDSTCGTTISLSQITGESSKRATFRGVLKFGSTPTGIVYQPFYSVKARGISGSIKVSGTASVTWLK